MKPTTSISRPAQCRTGSPNGEDLRGAVWLLRQAMKTCIACKQLCPIIEFYVHPQMTDGHLNKCKACCREHAQANYRRNREHYVEYDRLRFKTFERKQSVRCYALTMRNRHPQKYAARNAVANAVRDGRLFRPSTCDACGAGGRIEGHHEDYSKPLDVRWLCFACHRIAHGQTPTK